MGTFDGTDLSVTFPQAETRRKPLDWIDDKFGDMPSEDMQEKPATSADSLHQAQAVPA